jgi:isocitrate dehydrogenase
LEQGIHTYDIFKEGISTQKAGTKEFAEAIVANLGQEPITLTPVEYKANGGMPKFTYVRKPAAKKELVGVDVFVHWAGSNPHELGELASKSNNGDFTLKMISNRGIMVWPSGFPETFCTDHWRMRYKATAEGASLNNKMITELTSRLADLGIDFVKLENLYRFDGKDAYSLGQGQ